MYNQYLIKGKDVLKNKRNVISCFLIIIIFIAMFAIKEQKSVVSIVSNANEAVELGEGSVLTQNWVSNKKNVHGINLYFAQKPEVDADIVVNLITRTDGQVVRTAIRHLSEVENDCLEFAFDQYDCPEAMNFVIQVSMQNVDPINADSSIWLKVNSDYSGLKIDEESQNCGLGANVVYMKNRSVFVVFSILAMILIVANSFMLLWKKEFAEVIGMSVLSIGVTLYLFGLCGNVEYGMKFLYIVAGVGLIYILYHIWMGKCEIRKFLSFSVIGVCLFYVFSIVYNYNTIITDTDEFTHWALAVKDMFYSNQLSMHEGTSVNITRYPPFMALFQYFFMYQNQVFSEKFLYMAYQFAGFCLLVSWFGGKEKKSGLWKSVLYGVTFIFPLILYPRFYNSIMIDGFLGMLFAYVIYCYVSEKMDIFNTFRITLGLIALTLTKEMGIVLAGIACCVFMCDKIYHGVFEQKKQIKELIKSVLPVIWSGIITLITFFGWQWYCIINLDNLQQRNRALASEMIGHIPADASNELQFRVQVLLEGLRKIGNDIQIGSFSLIALLSIILVYLYFKRNSMERRKNFHFFVFLEGGFFIYFFVLIFLYATVFSREEALRTASINRYLFSYLAGIIYALLGCLINGNIKYKNNNAVLAIIACATIYFGSTTELLSMNQFVDKKQDLLWGYDDLEEKMHCFMEKGEKIFFWCDNTTQMSFQIFTYTACPFRRQFDEDGWSFRYHDLETDKVKTYEIDKIREILSNYDYVYIADFDEEAKRTYSQLFKNIDEFEQYGIYEVECEDGVYLEQIGYSPLKRVY